MSRGLRFFCHPGGPVCPGGHGPNAEICLLPFVPLRGFQTCDWGSAKPWARGTRLLGAVVSAAPSAVTAFCLAQEAALAKQSGGTGQVLR